MTVRQLINRFNDYDIITIGGWTKRVTLLPKRISKRNDLARIKYSEWTHIVLEKKFKEVRLCDNYEEISNNKTEFAEKYNLQQHTNSCLKENNKTHKGWEFSLIVK